MNKIPRGPRLTTHKTNTFKEYSFLTLGIVRNDPSCQNVKAQVAEKIDAVEAERPSLYDSGQRPTEGNGRPVNRDAGFNSLPCAFSIFRERINHTTVVFHEVANVNVNNVYFVNEVSHA